MTHEILVRELIEYAENGKSLVDGYRLCRSAASAVEILDRLCDLYESERDAAIEELRGKCSVCKSYTPFHRRDKCLNCKWDNASPACPIEYQEDNWEWEGVQEV